MSITASHSSLEVYEKPLVDRSITQAEYLRINPQDSTTTALNSNGSLIRFELNATDSFIHIKDSYLHVEGNLVKSDGATYGVDDDIGFTHNGIMHCVREVEYLINDRQVERVSNVGHATTMLGTLKYSQDFAISQGESQMWVKDIIDNANGNEAAITSNTGHAIRKQLTQNKMFSLVIPLSHILGFADSYDKVLYGAKHTLILTRYDDKLALMRNGTQGAQATPVAVTADGKVSITSISWYVPKVVPKPSVQETILAGVVSKVSVPLAYVRCEVNSYTLAQVTNQYVELGSKDIQEMPRYVVVAFQTARTNQTANGSTFDSINLQDIGVEIGSVKYPLESYDLDFTNGKVARAHREATKFSTKFYGLDDLVTQSFLSLREYKKLYPIFIVDCSHHESQDRSGSIQVRLRIRTSAAVPAATQAFVLTLSERVMSLESDGSRFSRLV